MAMSNRPQNKAKKRTQRFSYTKGLNKEFERRLRGLDNIVDFTQESPDLAPARRFFDEYYGTFINEKQGDF